MKKCFVLFILLIAALICAAVMEAEDIKIESDWDKVALTD